jgi:hypothetical protein
MNNKVERILSVTYLLLFLIWFVPMIKGYNSILIDVLFWLWAGIALLRAVLWLLFSFRKNPQGNSNS